MQWEIVIGLEVHAQLSTSSKIFSGASTAFGAEPNTQADAVSLALPGVLPVLNRGAVERAIKFGLATGAHVAPRSVFARKNYFYPDLPKGYQISQFDLPVVGSGQLAIHVPASGNVEAYEKTVRITRAHLEEDAGKSLHEDFGETADETGELSRRRFHGMTGIDLNRAGTPLLEIVSEPDMRSAAEAIAYAKTLHSLVRWIGICDGNMQEGSFRCDVNVSVRRPGAELGTRREIKNLNSFKFMQQAIDYEVQWQIERLENGDKIHQATILFDPDKGETLAMRSKEDAHDYRYFPDPDLLPLEVTPQMLEQVRATLPELPQPKQARYVNELGLSSYDAGFLTSSREMASYFEECVEIVGAKNAKICANWIMGEISRHLNAEERGIETAPLPPKLLAELIKRIQAGVISNNAAKQVFEDLWNAPQNSDGTRPQQDIDEIIAARGLIQMNDIGAIEKIVDEIIAANPAQVAEYRAGRDKVFGFFVGIAMKASRGKANPAQLNEVLKRKLAA